MKKILITGSSGYVGNSMMKTFAKLHPQVTVLGMSRSGTTTDKETQSLPNVKYIKGNCLHPKSFEGQLEEVDGIIHCVGTLLEKKNNPEQTHDAMNRDSCINMAKALNEEASKKG